jgi:hypothetical protein
VSLGAAPHTDSLTSLMRVWVRAITSAAQYETVIDLYKGRSFTEAKGAADAIDAELYVISAGHGLIHSEDRLPAYNLSVSASPGNELPHLLLGLQKTAADWWQLLTQQFPEDRSVSAMMSRTGAALVLLAVPSPYLRLISKDLGALEDEQIARLRIFTSEFGASELPQRLRSAVMPYNEQLEGLPNYSGTRVDFPQRALRHFVVVLKGHLLPLDLAKDRIVHSMSELVKPVLPKREKKSDAEIAELIKLNWARLNGSSAALLRFLRDDALVACEQNRFAILRRGVQTILKSEAEAHG